MTIDIATSVMLLVGIIVFVGVQELVKIFIQKLFPTPPTPQYLTMADLESKCANCANQYKEKDAKWEKKLDALTKVTVAIAVQMEVDIKDIQGLL